MTINTHHGKLNATDFATDKCFTIFQHDRSIGQTIKGKQILMLVSLDNELWRERERERERTEKWFKFQTGRIITIMRM